MKYLTFLPQFHSLITDGSKRMTIRQTIRLELGERFALRFWTGKAYRSPMGFLGYATCLHVVGITVDDGLFTYGGNQHLVIPDEIAKADGFSCGSDMFDHFKEAYGLPFNGFAHRWHQFAAIPPNPEASGRSSAAPTCWADPSTGAKP
jgi:hypothetical protein